MMYAVLQKAGVENRNGRVYPRDILQREVDKVPNPYRSR